MNGAEFIEVLVKHEKLSMAQAVDVMKTAQEDGYSAFESGVKQHGGFCYDYDVEAEQDFDGSWSFTYGAMQ